MRKSRCNVKIKYFKSIRFWIFEGKKVLLGLIMDKILEVYGWDLVFIGDLVIMKFKEAMVGVAGFKPTTSPTPRVRANQAAPYSVNFKRPDYSKNSF